MPKTRKHKKRGGLFGLGSLFKKKTEQQYVPVQSAELVEGPKQENEVLSEDRKTLEQNINTYLKNKCIPRSLKYYVDNTRKRCKGFFSKNVYKECGLIRGLPAEIGVCEEGKETAINYTVDKIVETIGFVKVIDGITFCAISMVIAGDIDKSPHVYGEYDKIRLVSTDAAGTNRFFWAYQSTSELGMWRFCSGTIYESHYRYTKFNNMAYNGKVYGDYVQTTLLHVELQKYLNIVYKDYRNQLLEITNALKTQRIEEPLDGLERFDDGETSCSKAPKEVFKFINPATREITATPFDIFDSTQQCGNTTVDINVLTEFSRQFELEYEVVDTTILLEGYEFRRVMDTSVEGEISEMHIVGDIKQYILKRKPMWTEGDTRTNHIKLICLETKEINMNANLFFWRVPKTRPQRQTLQTITQRGLPIQNRMYHMPITLVPIIDGVAECNVYGLYTHYIRAGFFVCKLLDYIQQCRPDERHRERCLRRYVFIGDRYNNLFPFRQTPPTPTPTETTGGGKRRKSRRMGRRKLGKSRRTLGF